MTGDDHSRRYDYRRLAVTLDMWRKAECDAALDRNATEWWQKWGDVCLKLAEGM